MSKWSVVVNSLPGPHEIVITWPAADPQAPPLTAVIRFMDAGQAAFVADAIAAKLLTALGPSV